MTDSEPQDPKVKRLVNAGGHFPGNTDPIAITPSGKIVGLEKTEILDPTGKVIATSLAAGELPIHRISTPPHLDTTDPDAN